MKKTIYFIIASLTVILGITLIGNIMLIGEKIGAGTHVYVEYSFYFIIALLLFYLVVIPVAKLLLMPEFPTLKAEDDWDAGKMKKFAFLLAGSSEGKSEMRKAVSEAGEDIEALRAIICEEIGKRTSRINSLVSDCGKKVFFLTAASQNSTLDTLSVIVLNIRLIYRVVYATGFRPNIFQLSRIMAAVLGSAFTAYISQTLTNSLEGGFKNVFANTGFPIIGPVLSMLLNGSLNAAITLYVGYTTRDYVVKGPESLKNESDKAGVISRVVSLASEFIKDGLSSRKEAVADKAGALVTKVSDIGKSFIDRVSDWFYKKEQA